MILACLVDRIHNKCYSIYKCDESSGYGVRNQVNLCVDAITWMMIQPEK